MAKVGHPFGADDVNDCLLYELKKYFPARKPSTFIKSFSLNPGNARLAVREQDHDVPGPLDAGIENLLKLDYIYQDGGIEKKREVIASMYPEKLTFDRERPRTTRINDAVQIIYTLDKAFSENEKGQSENIDELV